MSWSADTFSDSERSLERVAQARPRVESLRGLPFLRAVDVEVESPDTLRANLEDRIDEEIDPAEVAGSEAAWRLLRLVPADYDALGAYLAILEENVGGYYDPDQRRLVLVAQGSALGVDRAMLSALEEMVITHELVHALQDQHFDLRRLEPARPGDGDAALAQRALIEGDASYAMLFAMMPTNPDELPAATLKDLIAAAGGPSGEMGGAIGAAPAILRDPLIFPYLAGLSFVHALRQGGGGWNPVNDAFQEPPLSTEQILHPDRYLTRDLPTRLTAKRARRWVPGKRLIYSDTVGELGVQTLMRHHRMVNAEALAAGWDGDRIWVYRDGASESAIWGTVWDTVEDAGEFEEAILAILPDCRTTRSGADVWVFLAAPVGAEAAVAASEVERTPLRTLDDLRKR